MTTDIIIIALLLIFAAIWWVIPKTRRSVNNWVIGLKTFPLGLIALTLTGNLVQFAAKYWSELHLKNVAIPLGVKLAIPLAAALVVIVVAGIYLKRRGNDGKKYNPLPSISLFILAVIPTGILGFFISLALTFSSRGIQNYHADWQTLWLELGTREKVAFEQQSIHPFLAEYNYRLRFVADGETARQMLFVNTGGRTHFNIYKLADGRFLFRDKDWDYIVDVPAQQVQRLALFEGKLYAATIPNAEITSWSGPYRIGDKFFMDFGSHRAPATEVTGILDNMRYCGCIKDNFYPAAELPETKIDFRRPTF